MDSPDKLYHFTAVGRLPLVMEFGITRGDVPITPSGGYNAPWLTADPSFASQGWSTGSIEDKRQMRLTVEIPASHRNLLNKWTDIAEAEGMNPLWLRALHESGGGGHDKWYVYHGVIQPVWITYFALDKKGGV